MKSLLARLPLALLLAPLAPAQITVVSQLRSIAGDAQAIDINGVPTTDAFLVDAPGLGLFDETRIIQVSNPDATATTRATLTSDLTSSRITGFGTNHVTGGSGDLTGAAWWDGDASVNMDVVFDVAADVDFTLTGTLSAWDYSTPYVYLEDASGAQIAGTAPSSQSTIALADSGVLTPGRYRLRASSSGTGGGNGWWYLSDSSSFNFALDLSIIVPGTPFCAAPFANSAGTHAAISASGSNEVADADLTFHVEGAVPNQFGLFFYGSTQTQTTLAGGLQCAGGSVFRLTAPAPCDSTGAVSFPVDFGASPVAGGAGAFAAGTTWNFQYWYRDPGDPTGANTSNGYSITFE